MAKSYDDIISEILEHVDSFDNSYSEWYVGITNNPDANHSRHGNPNEHNFWRCSSNNIARSVEDYFLDLGFQGGKGGGNKTSVYVYVYFV